MAFRWDIQILRALAVFSVFAYHSGLPWFHGGSMGVDIFFVISGYLIATGLLREIGDAGTLSRERIRVFYRRRLARTVPAALTAAVGILLLGAIFTPNDLGGLAGHFAFSVLWLENLLLTGIGVFPGSVPLPAVTSFTPYWSLAMEEQFYLAFPWVLVGVLAMSSWALGRRCRGAAAESGMAGDAVGDDAGDSPAEIGDTWAAVSSANVVTGNRYFLSLIALVLGFIAACSFALFLSWGSSETLHSTAYFSPFTRVWQLVVGALLAVGLAWIAQRRARHHGAGGAPGRPLRRVDLALPWAVCAWALGTLVICLNVGSYTDWRDSPGWTLGVVLSTSLIVVVGRRLPPLGGKVERLLRPVFWLATVSFGMYLWHSAVINSMNVVVDQHSMAWWVLVVGLSLSLAGLSWKMVEQPAMKWARGREGVQSPESREAKPSPSADDRLALR